MYGGSPGPNASEEQLWRARREELVGLGVWDEFQASPSQTAALMFCQFHGTVMSSWVTPRGGHARWNVFFPEDDKEYDYSWVGAAAQAP